MEKQGNYLPTSKELNKLASFLSVRQKTFRSSLTINQLYGFLYGVMLIPEYIYKDKWAPIAFDGNPEFNSKKQEIEIYRIIFKICYAILFPGKTDFYRFKVEERGNKGEKKEKEYEHGFFPFISESEKLLDWMAGYNRCDCFFGKWNTVQTNMITTLILNVLQNHVEASKRKRLTKKEKEIYIIIDLYLRCLLSSASHCSNDFILRNLPFIEAFLETNKEYSEDSTNWDPLNHEILHCCGALFYNFHKIKPEKKVTPSDILSSLLIMQKHPFL